LFSNIIYTYYGSQPSLDLYNLVFLGLFSPIGETILFDVDIIQQKLPSMAVQHGVRAAIKQKSSVPK